MTTSQSTPNTVVNSATFQIDTQQVQLPKQAPNSNIQSVQIGDDQVRIDASRDKSSHHLRATQLSEFTNWLNSNQKQQSPRPKIQQAATKPTAKKQPNPQAATKKIYRVDKPTAIKKPNFPTGNYVADPDEIRRIIQKLKSDGRIIADNQQVAEPKSTQTSQQPSVNALANAEFTWPRITSNLVGSPAVLNLEMNVDGPTNQHYKQLVITSTQSGTGATTIAISLARQLAKHNNRVLLVDGNISNAAMTNRLGVGQSKSWIHALSQRSSMAEVMWQDVNSSISLLPITPIKTSVTWKRKIYDELAKIIDSVAWDLDFVLFDVGNHQQFIDESIKPGKMADITLLVNGKNIAGVADQRRAENQLTEAGVKDMLVVQNFSRVSTLIKSRVG